MKKLIALCLVCVVIAGCGYNKTTFIKINAELAESAQLRREKPKHLKSKGCADFQKLHGQRCT